MTAFKTPPHIAAQETAIDTLARTIWGEAYAEPVRGKEAVAAVVMNRVKQARSRFGFDWWGGTVVEACLGPEQFECWRHSPGARRGLMNVRPDDPVFAVCRRIACRAVRGALVDPTRGAVRYHRAQETPWWAHGLEPTIAIGRRLFYRDPHEIPEDDGADTMSPFDEVPA